MKENSRERYKKFPQEEKIKIKECQRKRYHQLIQYKKEALEINNFLFFLSIKNEPKKH